MHPSSLKPAITATFRVLPLWDALIVIVISAEQGVRTLRHGFKPREEFGPDINGCTA